MFDRALENWKEKNGCYPEKVLIYRDGVGEGQFLQVVSIFNNSLLFFLK